MKKQMFALKNQFDERKQDWLEQKLRLWRLQKLDTIQAGPLCLLPDQEKASAGRVLGLKKSNPVVWDKQIFFQGK